MDNNLLYYGDNLDVLKLHIKSETVDLIYLDPPFNSNQDYNVIFAEKEGARSSAQIKAFGDTWQWDQDAAKAYEAAVEKGGKVSDALRAFRIILGTNDMMAYISQMSLRLIELYRVLRSTGSIYLHCDPTASHYLKMLMDAIFRPQNFKNEIVWGYKTGGTSKKHFARKHDIILFYTKNPKDTFNVQYYRSYQAKKYNYSKKYPEYLDEETGRWYHLSICRDVWDDIHAIGTDNRERLGYPTQKPEALLERIINASSREGDTVLDPFCGCGTTIAVAQRLKRRWIGIDITFLATNLIKHRLQDAYGDEVDYKVIGEPVSLSEAEELANEDKYQFQWWALGLVGARPTDEKKGADKGIDGRLFFHDDPTNGTKQIIFSVKGGKTSVRDVRDLRGVVEREDAQIGVLITMQKPTRPMIQEASGYPCIQISVRLCLLVPKHLNLLSRLSFAPARNVIL